MRVTRPALAAAASLAFFVTHLAGSGPANASPEATFAPAADAYVDEAQPLLNLGTDSRLIVDGDSGTGLDQQAYLRFAVSGLSGTVTSARLRLYAYDGSVNGPALYRTSGAWAETTITWNSRPPPSGSALADLGAVSSNSWVEFDVTSVVAAEGSYGFVLLPTSGDAVRFYSREGSTPPQLVVTTDAAAAMVASVIVRPSEHRTAGEAGAG